MDRYAFRVRWSAQDDEYVATVDELPSVSWLAEDREDAMARVRWIVRDIIADLLASGDQPPAAGTAAG